MQAIIYRFSLDAWYFFSTYLAGVPSDLRGHIQMWPQQIARHWLANQHASLNESWEGLHHKKETFHEVSFSKPVNEENRYK